MKHLILKKAFELVMLIAVTLPAAAQEPSPADTTLTATAEQVTTTDDKQLSDSLFWEPVVQALIYHETKGNPNVTAGPYAGPLQMTVQLVNSVNTLLKQRGINKRYTARDRYDIQKSKEMFVVIMQRYNPERDIDKAIRIWAGGTRYSVRATQKHVNGVRAIMKKQAK